MQTPGSKLSTFLESPSTLYWTLLGGSWVVVSTVISSITILITHIRELITPLLPTHEPPSKI